HQAAAVLLVARPRPRLVVVARGDEAEAEAARPRRRGVEVREREHVLRGAARAVVEGGVEAVAALPTVIPVLDLAVGDRRPPRAVPCGMTITSTPHCESFSKSSCGVSAVS